MMNFKEFNESQADRLRHPDSEINQPKWNHLFRTVKQRNDFLSEIAEKFIDLYPELECSRDDYWFNELKDSEKLLGIQIEFKKFLDWNDGGGRRYLAAPYYLAKLKSPYLEIINHVSSPKKTAEIVKIYNQIGSIFPRVETLKNENEFIGSTNLFRVNSMTKFEEYLSLFGLNLEFIVAEQTDYGHHDFSYTPSIIMGLNKDEKKTKDARGIIYSRKFGF